MKKLADISTFTNLMNQSNSVPVQNGFMDKAKKALYPVLITGGLLGASGIGYGVGHHKGHNEGYIAGQEKGQNIWRERGYETGFGEGYNKGWYDLNQYSMATGDTGTISDKLDWLELAADRLSDSIDGGSPKAAKIHRKELLGMLFWCDRYFRTTISTNPSFSNARKRFEEIKNKIERDGLVSRDAMNQVSGKHGVYGNPYYDKDQIPYGDVWSIR